MLAGEILSEQVIPLKKNDACEAAVGFMSQMSVFELPVVEAGKLIGYLTISEAIINQNKSVGQALNANVFQIKDNTHLFDVARILADTNRNCLAVCNQEDLYIGSITATDVVKAIGQHSFLASPGAIVTLEIWPRDYSLTELSRIVESNNIKIIAIFIKNTPSQKLEVNIKFNSTEINSILNALERYNYQIKAIHQASQNQDDYSNRLDWLIKYMNT